MKRQAEVSSLPVEDSTLLGKYPKTKEPISAISYQLSAINKIFIPFFDCR
jgi:hypothetical protein